MHHLQLRHRRAVDLARLGARQRFIERAARHAECGGADGGAEDVERRHRDLEAFAWVADEVVARDADVFETQARERMRGDERDAFGDCEAACVGINDDGADAFGAGRFAGAGEDDVEAGDAAVGDPGLLAVEDVVIAVGGRGECERGGVRTGFGFGKREGGDAFAGGDVAEIVCALQFGAEERDWAGAQALHGEDEVEQAGMAREVFADQAEAAHVEWVFAATHGVFDEATFDHLREKLGAGGVDFVFVHVMREGRLVEPRIERGGEIAMARFEEGPVEIALVSHQSPSNTGFCFDAKAT